MEGSRVAELAQRIYQTHRDALEVIFEHRPDELQNLSDALKRKMEDTASELRLEPMVCNKGYIRFMPMAWKTEENLQGKGWGNRGSAFVMCEFVVLAAGPFSRLLREKHLRLGAANCGILHKNHHSRKRRKRAKKPEMWMTIYSVRNSVVHLNDLELGQEGEVGEKLWDWVKKQLRDPDFETSAARIAQHLAKLEP